MTHIPAHHVTSAQDGSGVQTISPAGLAHWLSEHPQHQWPGTYQGLARIGLHSRIVEWLELGVAEDQPEHETEVVQAFLAVVQELVQRPPGEPILWRMPRAGTETLASEIRSDILYVLLQADAGDWPQAIWDYDKPSPWVFDKDFEIPPFPRLPPDGTRELTEFVLRSVNIKIQKLAGLGLRPMATCWNTGKSWKISWPQVGRTLCATTVGGFERTYLAQTQSQALE